MTADPTETSSDGTGEPQEPSATVSSTAADAAPEGAGAASAAADAPRRRRRRRPRPPLAVSPAAEGEAVPTDAAVTSGDAPPVDPTTRPPRPRNRRRRRPPPGDPAARDAGAPRGPREARDNRRAPGERGDG